MLGENKKNKIDLLTILAFLIVARLSCPVLSNIPFMSVGFVFIYGVLFCSLYLLLGKRLNQSEVTILIIVLCYTIFVCEKAYDLFIGGKDCEMSYLRIYGEPRR
jgi:hypothetical protein